MPGVVREVRRRARIEEFCPGTKRVLPSCRHEDGAGRIQRRIDVRGAWTSKPPSSPVKRSLSSTSRVPPFSVGSIVDSFCAREGAERRRRNLRAQRHEVHANARHHAFAGRVLLVELPFVAPSTLVQTRRNTRAPRPEWSRAVKPLLILYVPQAGFEPATPALGERLTGDDLLPSVSYRHGSTWEPGHCAHAPPGHLVLPWEICGNPGGDRPRRGSASSHSPEGASGTGRSRRPDACTPCRCASRDKVA